MFHNEHKQLNKIYMSWRTTDEIFGQPWPDDESHRASFGHRPPDDPAHPTFTRSLLLPFDACDADGEGLFEARLQHMLCQ